MSSFPDPVEGPQWNLRKSMKDIQDGSEWKGIRARGLGQSVHPKESADSVWIGQSPVTPRTGRETFPKCRRSHRGPGSHGSLEKAPRGGVDFLAAEHTAGRPPLKQRRPGVGQTQGWREGREK